MAFYKFMHATLFYVVLKGETFRYFLLNLNVNLQLNVWM
jgi:hypothetical protein